MSGYRYTANDEIRYLRKLGRHSLLRHQLSRLDLLRSYRECLPNRKWPPHFDLLRLKRELDKMIALEEGAAIPGSLPGDSIDRETLDWFTADSPEDH